MHLHEPKQVRQALANLFQGHAMQRIRTTPAVALAGAALAGVLAKVLAV